MSEHQRPRDEQALPMFHFTCDLATLAPAPPEMQQLFGASTASGKSAAYYKAG
jgi:hypothetical protein